MSDIEFPEEVVVSFRGETLRRFRVFEDFEKWVSDEIEARSELEKALSGISQSFRNPIIQQTTKFQNDLNNHIQAFFRDKEGSGELHAFKNLVAQIEKLETQRDLIVFQTTEGKEYLETAKESPFAAAFRMASDLELKLDVGVIGGDLIQFIDGVLYDRMGGFDPKRIVDANRKNLKRLKTDWDKRFKDLETQMCAQTEKEGRIRLRILKRIRAFVGTHKDMLDEHRNRVETIQENHEKTMAEMEQAFSTKMKLMAGERMWGFRRKIHEKKANCWFWVFFVASIITAGVFLGVAYAFGGETTVFGENGLSAYAVGGLVLLIIAFWILRTFGSEYRRHRALADDAEERETMVKTFKALEYEDHASEEQRAVILQALFRPHGLAPEETLPHPVWESIIKRFNSPQK